MFYCCSILYPYSLLAALFRKLNSFNLTLIVETSTRRRTVYKQFSNQFASFHLQNCRKNEHVIHRRRSVRIGKNCARRLEYGPTLGRTQDRPVNNIIVASKCRLAPPNGDTIPRLELLGAILGARLLNSLRQEYHGILKIDDEFLWTDSSVALEWINQGPRVGGVFVADCVEQITAVGGVWSWVPTDEILADLATRVTTVAQLADSKIWWNGPHWLKGPETEWPKHQKNDTDVTLVMMAVADSQQPERQEDIVDPSRTSKYLRTLRSVAWILRRRKPIENTQTCCP